MHRSVGALLGIAFAAPLLGVSPPTRVHDVALGASPVAVTVNPSAGEVISLSSDGMLDVVDETARDSARFLVAADAFALTVDTATDRIYVSSNTYVSGVPGGTLTLVEPSTGLVRTANALYLGAPTANSTTHRIYVTDPYYGIHSGVGLHSVSVFDGDTLDLHFVTIGGSRSVALAVDEVHDKVYVAALGDTIESARTLAIVDAATEDVSERPVDCPQLLPSATGVSLIAVDPGLNQAWAACSGDPRILEVSPDSPTIRSYALTGVPTLLAVDAVAHKLYVALDGLSSIVEIDANLRSVIEIPVSGAVTGLATNPQTGTVYASHADTGMVTLIDRSSHATLEVSVGPGAGSIVVDSNRDIAWVATANGLAGLYGAGSPCPRCTRVVQRPAD